MNLFSRPKRQPAPAEDAFSQPAPRPYFQDNLLGSLWSVVKVSEVSPGLDLVTAYEVPESGEWVYRGNNVYPEGEPIHVEFRTFLSTFTRLVP